MLQLRKETMDTRLSTNVIGATAALLLFGGMASGCGPKDNNLSTFQEPAVQLSEPTSGSFELQLPNRPGEPREQNVVRVRSAGEADLTITGIEWVGEKPERLFMANSRETDVAEDDCDSEIYYPASRVCIKTGAPDISETILAPGSEFEIQFHIAAYDNGEVNGIDCPTPPPSVPENLQDRFCGAIKVTTNARNDNSQVTAGEATVYFLSNPSSGRIQLSAPSVVFQNVRPGFSDSRTFSITNSGDNDLTVDSVQVTDFGQYISIEGAEPPFVLAPQAQEVYTVQVNLPASLTDAELELLSDPGTAPQIRVESSAPDSPNEIQLDFDTSTTLPPIPQVDKGTLVFAGDQDVQDIVLTNPGDAPVSITGVSFEPSAARDYYAFLFEGSPFMGPKVIRDASMSDPDRNKETFSVRFTSPATPEDSPLSIMTINYNYFVGDIAQSGTLRVTLLGDRGMAPYADLSPTTFSFSTQDTERQVRTAVIRNLGTTSLDLGDMVDYMPLGAGGFEEFQVRLVDGSLPSSIPAGGIAEVEVSFTATDGDVDQVSAIIDSNTETAEEIYFTLSSFDVPPAGTEITVTPEFSGNATVGALALFSFEAGTSDSLSNNAQWVLLEKPDASKLTTKAVGPRQGIVPDVAGSYTLLVTTSDGVVDLQTRVSFTAE